jgi:hypothetical protein
MTESVSGSAPFNGESLLAALGQFQKASSVGRNHPGQPSHAAASIAYRHISVDGVPLGAQPFTLREES